MKYIVTAAVFAAGLSASVANADDPSDHVIGKSPSGGVTVTDSSRIIQSGADAELTGTDTDRAILLELQRIRVALESGNVHIPCDVKVKNK